jgi:adenylate cyclase
MDRIQVKGKTRAVEIHELLARPGKVHACDLADQFTAAMHDYFGGRFAQAGQQFDALAQRYKDPPSVVFSKRCHTFMRRPPPDDWDGIFIAPGK